MTSIDSVIDYFVAKKFGTLIAASAPMLANIDMYKNSNFIKQAAEIEEYRTTLRNMPLDKLLTLHEEALENDSKFLEIQTRRVEKNRFYNLQEAYTDLEHWSKAAYWTLDEAVSLSFSREPTVVNWPKIKPFENKSDFVKDYRKRLDLVLRETDTKDIEHKIKPLGFIKWALELDLYLPDKLLNEVEKRVDFNDDKKNDDLLEKYEALKVAHDGLLVEFESVKNEKQKSESPRQINNLLRTLTSVAIEIYRLDPRKEKAELVRKIIDDMSKHTKPMDNQIINDWLSEGVKQIKLQENRN